MTGQVSTANRGALIQMRLDLASPPPERTTGVWLRWVSDRVALMFRGAIVEIETSPETFATPRHPYTLSLLDAMPRLVPEKRSRPPVLPTEGDSGAAQGCWFRAGHAACRVGVWLCHARPGR